MTGRDANPAAMWDERFRKAEAVYGEEPNGYLRVQAKQRLQSGMKVLVPGDGYGRNGIWLATQGMQVTTVDVSSVGVERARAAASEAGVQMEILLSDLNAWKWPEAEFDAAASIFLHLWPEQRAGVHARMLRALKRGGILIFEAFTPGQLKHTSGGPKQLELLYTAEILREDFSGAEFLELAEVEVELDEGKMHRGPGAVVRGVFRKP
jgi:SAM-dependent methyltransferase